jgi:REP element-mobilizing transposase RayT
MPHARNRRLDAQQYAHPGLPCFHTIRCAPGCHLFIDARWARIAVDCLLAQQVKSSCRLDVYCVMPDHVHLMVTPERDNASSLLYLQRFKGWCARELHRGGWTGEVRQKRSYDHLVRQHEDLRAIAAYILANPVRRGLCTEPEEYPWSGMAEIYRG